MNTARPPEGARTAAPRGDGAPADAETGAPAAPWQRRARPLLGTLVEVGIPGDAADTRHRHLFDLAFGAVAAVQSALSRFEPHSDVSRFHALPCGGHLRVGPHTREVLAAAQHLHGASKGLFDVSLGTAPRGWHLDGFDLHRQDAAVRLDLGGIGKGHAVDCAVQALVGAGCSGGWVNAGGDLRVFGAAEVPLVLRDERTGGVRHFGRLAEGAFATSHFGAGRRASLTAHHGHRAVDTHVSVAAPQCLWADALTKVVALSAESPSTLLEDFGAQAWRH